MSTEVGKLYVQFDADGRPYIQGLQQIDARTKAFQRDQQTAFGKLGTAIKHKLGLGMAAGAAAVVAGGTLITKSLIKTAASYEYEMSRIKAVTNATTAEMKALDAIALKLGKDTVFSANEAAQGINELAKAGVSVADILGGGISGTLALAAAGELEVAAAAEVASNAMNIFGLTGKDVGMVADTLAAAANASSLEVSDLAYSMKYAGPVAQSLGIPFQQLVAILAELGNQGIRGEQAGAGLASMLQALTAPTDAATRQLEQYGIAIYDAESNMRSMPDILGDMNAALNNLDDESRMTFVQAVFGKGSDSAIALKLIEGGSKALEEMTKTVSKQGEAARVSAEKMDNFRGSMEELRGSVETLTIKVGTPMINALRPFVDKLSEGVDWAADFYDGLQNLSGWEGADLGGKIRIAWDELTRQFDEWFSESGESTLADMSQAVGKGLVDVASTVGTTAAQFLLGVIGLDDSTWGKAGRTIAAGFLTGIAEGIVEQIWDAAMYLARGRLADQGILPEEAGVITFAVEYHVSERTAIDLLETMGKISEEAAKHMRDKLDAGLELGEPGKKNAEKSGETGGKLFVDEFGNVLPKIIPYYNSVMNQIDAAGTGAAAGRAFEAGFMSELSDINVLIQEKFDIKASAYAKGKSTAGGLGLELGSSMGNTGGMKPQTVALLGRLGALFPINMISGYRANDQFKDHPSGTAFDITWP
ncbi:MAG TPA: phage tail tape measure protein, partial [Anaerolineae bacterium]|nr:phage tail tape measure protein [Anaerolineae bacterium]